MGPPFSHKWLAAACGVASTVLGALWAAGAINWQMHVILGILFALIGLALALLVYP